MTELQDNSFSHLDARIVPNETTIRGALQEISESEAVWDYLGYPLIIMATNKQSDYLNDEKQAPHFFSEALDRIFNGNPLESTHNGILVVLHFQEEQGQKQGLVTAVKTHDLNMGSINVLGNRVPAFMDWKHHGQPCSDLSMRTKQNGYPFINTSQLWEIIDQKMDTIPFPSLKVRKKRLKELGFIR